MAAADTSLEQLKQREYYRRTAHAYDAWHTIQRDEHLFALEHILIYLRMCGAQSVLDSGCGTGRGLKFLSERAPELRLHGNDPSPDLLTLAAEKHGVPADCLDCVGSEQLPYENGSFDAVIATGVLHHVPDPNRVVAEFVRVARKAVFISDANIYGQGPMPVRVAKLLLARARLLRTVNWLRRGGHHWFFSEGDGIAYSYSAFDAVPLLRSGFSHIFVVPTLGPATPIGLPLLGAPHLLVCAFSDRIV